LTSEDQSSKDNFISDQPPQKEGFAFLCDRQGKILRVIYNSFGGPSGILPEKLLTALVDQSSLSKTLDFLATVRDKGVVFDWELNLSLEDRLTALYFTGYALDEQLLVVARPSDSGMSQVYYEQLSRLNNELGTLHRELAKKNVILEQLNEQKNRFLSQLQVEQAQLQHLTETLEAQVASRTEQVKALATALSLAEEQERKRLAQTLHDDLQQTLYSQLLKLKILRDKHGGDELSDFKNEINEAIQGLDQAINMTRSLAVELSPPVLKEAPFAEVLQWLVTHMEEEHYVKFHLSVQGQCHIPKQQIQTLLLQMIRELLFNAVKHAGTNQGRIYVWQEDKFITIRIEDDGKGFDVEAVQAREKQRGRFGLSSVKERLALIGGRLEITSESGRGTQMTLVAPVE
jgi:signal transduction histidine kinase